MCVAVGGVYHLLSLSSTCLAASMTETELAPLQLCSSAKQASDLRQNVICRSLVSHWGSYCPRGQSVLPCGQEGLVQSQSQLICVNPGNWDSFRGLQGAVRLTGSSSTALRMFTSHTHFSRDADDQWKATFWMQDISNQNWFDRTRVQLHPVSNSLIVLFLHDSCLSSSKGCFGFFHIFLQYFYAINVTSS